MDPSQPPVLAASKGSASHSAQRRVKTNPSTSYPPPAPPPPLYFISPNINNGASSSSAGLYISEFPTPTTAKSSSHTSNKSYKPSVFMEYVTVPDAVHAELTTAIPFPKFYPSKFRPTSHSSATSPCMFSPDLRDDMEGLKISFIKKQDLEDLMPADDHLAVKTTHVAPYSSLYLNNILNPDFSSQRSYILNPHSIDPSPPKGLEDLIHDHLANKTTLVAPYSSLYPNNILNPAIPSHDQSPYINLNLPSMDPPYSSLYHNNILNPAIPSQSPHILNPSSMVDPSPPKGYESNLVKESHKKKNPLVTKGSNDASVVKDIGVDQEGVFLYARVDMPGVSKEGLKVWQDKKQNMLYIEGKEMKIDGDEYSKEDEKELRSYSAGIYIDPTKYKLDPVKASLKNGVLKILVPKMKFEEMHGLSLVKVE